MSKQVKKTLTKIMALVMVVLLTTGAVSVMGMDTGEYQYNDSNIYIATETETGDDNAAETPDNGSDNGYYTGDDTAYGDNYADADYGNDNEIDSDYDDTDYSNTDYENEDYDYTEEDEYDEDEEDDEYGLYGLLVPVPLYNGIVAATQYAVSNFAELQAAVANPIVTEIEVLVDISDFTEAITIPTGRAITLVTSSNVTLTTQGNYRHFIVNGELTLTDDITLTSHNPTQDGGGIYVQDDATFIMLGGSITENRGSRGGGVLVNGTNGNFTMTGGTIENNTATQNGGGVAVQSGANFTMSGTALIYDNTVIGTSIIVGDGGGVFITDNNSEFTMTGGTIENNIATRNGGGVAVQEGANFTMSGTALIYDNTAEGTQAWQGGGGVRIDYNATFTMISGTIENNIATRDGGGVSVRISSFTMIDGLITNNTANGIHGGGVHIENNASFIMNDGQISRNRVLTLDANRGGAGVNVHAWSTFEMNGGIIGGLTEDDANTSSSGGGGVQIGHNTSFVMNGGYISRNVAEGVGGGLRLDGTNSIVVIDGGTITHNRAGTHGGGISAWGRADTSALYALTLLDATISYNTAIQNGGGIRLANHTGLLIHPNVTISNNTALNGGGIHVGSNDRVTAIGGVIVNNTANEYGGGIWTAAYNNINIADTVIFNGNTANAPHDHGIVNRGVLGNVLAADSGGGQGGNPQNVDWASVSIPNTHALNNFDINYTGTALFKLEVIVRDESGNPITDAEVVIRDDNGDIIFTGNTDGNGSVSILVPDGEYEVTASHPDFHDVPPVDVIVDGDDETVIITLPQDRELEVIVRDEDGNPIPGANVVIRDENDDIIFTGTTDGNGRVVVTVPNGEYTITASHPDYNAVPPVTVVVDGGDETVIIILPQDNGGGNNGGGNNGGGNGGIVPPALFKNPDNRYVNVGDTINWSLRNIHNYTGETVANFSIIDMPNRGLNFVSGNLPAFANGAGITFDIRYTVAGSSEWRTHATGVDASQPFSFSLPQNGNIHYTNIGFFFGTVPADFARGNEIILTFLVTNESPTNVLVNRFLLRYDNTERQGQGTAIVRPGDTPVTGGGFGGGGSWLPGTTPLTPGQDGYVGAQYVAPLTDGQTQTIYEQVELPVIYGYQEQVTNVTTDTTDTVSTITGRVNPQTGDNGSPIGIILSFAGVVTSLGVLLLMRRKNAA